jgi:hypothetical protein
MVKPFRKETTMKFTVTTVAAVALVSRNALSTTKGRQRMRKQWKLYSLAFIVIGMLSVPAQAQNDQFQTVLRGSGQGNNVVITESNPVAVVLDIDNTSSTRWRLQSVGSDVPNRAGNFDIFPIPGLSGLSIQPTGNVGIGRLPRRPGSTLSEISLQPALRAR